jgi:phosphoserine aminotransferase
VTHNFDFSLGQLALRPHIVKDAGRFALGAKTRLPDPRDEIRKLFAVPESHTVIVMKGDRILHHGLVALHFLRKGGNAGYFMTGSEARRALAAAQAIGDAREVTAVDPNTGYVHITSNNADEGVQWHTLPETHGVPLVCDMSEDLFFCARQIDCACYAFIYADVGAASIVIAEKAFIRDAGAHLPPGLRYASYDVAPPAVPALSIFLANVRMGRQHFSGTNAQNLYRVIDRYPAFFINTVERERRSQVTAVFRLPAVALEQAFLAEAARAGFVGLQAAQGLRVCMYAAVEGIMDLTRFMEDFAQRHLARNLSAALREQMRTQWPDAKLDDLPAMDRLTLRRHGSLAWIDRVAPDGTRRALRWRNGAWLEIVGLEGLRQMLVDVPCDSDALVAAYARFAEGVSVVGSDMQHAGWRAPSLTGATLEFFVDAYGLLERVTVSMATFDIRSEPAAALSPASNPKRPPLPAPFRPGTFVRYRGDPKKQPYIAPGDRHSIWDAKLGRFGTGELVSDPAMQHIDWGRPLQKVDATCDGSSVIRTEPAPQSALDFTCQERFIVIHWRDRHDWEIVE